MAEDFRKSVISEFISYCKESGSGIDLCALVTAAESYCDTSLDMSSVKVKKSPPGVKVKKSPPGVKVKKSPPGVKVKKSPPGVKVKKSPSVVVDRMKAERMSFTMGDAGENHAGMQLVGKLQTAGSGHTIKDLHIIKKYMENIGKNCEFIDMCGFEHEAGVLIIRNYIGEDVQRDVYNETADIPWDTQYYDTRRSKVLNKHARSNLVFLEGISQDPDYENAKGRIIDSDKLKMLGSVKRAIIGNIEEGLTEGGSSTVGIPYIMEGNRYFDLKKCGIGNHGDVERTRVICLSIGADDYPMQWTWFHKAKPVSEPYEIVVNSGDVYIMSEKAVGQDWKKSSKYTMRHAAGAEKYRSLERYKKKV
jgi:hypothetical protein